MRTGKNKENEDLLRKRLKIHKDIDYLKENKISLLRDSAMTMDEIRAEKEKLIFELEKLDAMQQAYTMSEEDMLGLVIEFSELCKMASELYKHAFDTEKQKLLKIMFSELVFKDGKIAKYKAKPAFEMLLIRAGVQDGSPD